MQKTIFITGASSCLGKATAQLFQSKGWYTIELAKLFSATIYVVVFVEKSQTDAIGYMTETHNLHHYISYLKKTFPGISFEGELLEGKEFEEAVIEYDEKNKLDIIAMITYPKGFWEKIFKGSVTRKMTFHSRIPVLAIPAGIVTEVAGNS